MCAKFNEYSPLVRSTVRKPAAFSARLGTIQTLFKTDCNFFVKSVDKFPISETHRRSVMAKHIYNTTPRITPFGTMRDVIFCSISKPSVIS